MKTNGQSRAAILAEHKEALLARAALLRSLALPSCFADKVGAAILLCDGRIVGGMNAPHDSMCAEGAALLGLYGRSVKDIVAIAIDGATVCRDHLNRLDKVDRNDFDPILVLHRHADGWTEFTTLDGEPAGLPLVATISVQTP